LEREAAMAKAELTIRSLAEGDRAAWEPLWDGYLRFYGTSAGPGLTDTTWARFHDPAEPVNALGAFTSVAAGTEQLVGIVHYIFHRSTWTTGPYCYLQDLFTAEGARGQTNATARTLYDTLAERPGFIQYRKLL
jgi:hypothetical protein